MADEHEAARAYTVVSNDEEQYSLWPVERAMPLGWREVGVRGSKAECLAHIKDVWTDMRPRSLRQAMASSGESPST